MSVVYLSLVLCLTAHHGVQLMLGINQGSNPFALVETRDTIPVYSCQDHDSEPQSNFGFSYAII